MKISYLVTFSTETDTLKNLLERLSQYQQDDEIVLLADVGNLGVDTQAVLMNCLRHKKGAENRLYFEHNLNNNYSEHKNWGIKQCSGDFIFQIDGDECPTETLLENIKDIIQSNPKIESFWIPRINDFIGVYDKIAKQWGWKLTPSISITHEKLIDVNSDEYHFLKNNNYLINDYNPLQTYLLNEKYWNTIKYKAVLVNALDPQCRLFKNKPEIQWVGRLHERIQGNKNFVYLPFDEDLALYHSKTIEKQIETNLRYNKLFTEKENQGFTLPTK